MGPDAMNDADINFYFDPLCPFAWMTSKGVRQVAAQRDCTVDWRFISLRMIHADVDGPSGVRVNAVNPGPTQTEGTAALDEAINAVDGGRTAA
jgi:hypothetical protein